MIRSAFIRPRKQSERESGGVRERQETREGERRGESTFIRADSIGFQAALREIRLECVVIPPGSPLYPASFRTLPRLSLSMRTSQSMILIKHHPGLGLYLLTAKKKKKKKKKRDAVKLYPQELQISCRAIK